MNDVLSIQEKTRLIQGELADLALYVAFRKYAHGKLATVLDEFIATETRHAAFWQQTFQLSVSTLARRGKVRNALLVAMTRLFGPSAMYLCLEAVESHGIQHYLALWEKTQRHPELQQQIHTILMEELQHEDEAATGGERQVHPELIRNAFLGFNDGSVEILGAVSGLVAALQYPAMIAVAAATVSVAGAISMGAGAFLSTHAEQELERIETAKKRFLGDEAMDQKGVSPWRAAMIVGIGYVIGAAVPVAPFFFGVHSPWWSIVLSGTLILAVSAFLSFLSGMNVRKRMMMNAGMITIAVLISYLIGTALDHFVG